MEPEKQSKYAALIKIDAALTKFETWLTVTCFIFMCLFVIIGIIMRFLLKIPNQYGEEISRYLMVCGVFIGVSIGVRQKAHLGVTLFVEKLPQFWSKVVFIMASLITTAAYTVLAILSLKFVVEMKNYGQTSPAMGLPVWIIYFALSIGLVLSTFRAILVFLNEFIVKSFLPMEEKRMDAS